MTSPHTTARIAGLTYVLSSATAAYNYGGMQQFEAGGAKALAHIDAWAPFFARASVIGSFGFVLFLISALAFYRLLRPLAPIAATLLLAFVATGVPITLVAFLHQLDLVTLLNAEPALSGEIRQAQIAASLRGYDNAILLSAMFWGLWLGPLGWGMFKAGGIVPRILGVALMIAVIPYCFFFAGHFLLPNSAEIAPLHYFLLACGTCIFIGEFGTMLWLVILGAPGRLSARGADA